LLPLFLLLKSLFISIPHNSLFFNHLRINKSFPLSLLHLLLKNHFHLFFSLKLILLFVFILKQVLNLFLLNVTQDYLILSVLSLVHFFDDSFSHSVLILSLFLLSFLIFLNFVSRLLIKDLHVSLLNSHVLFFLFQSLILLSLFNKFRIYHHLMHLVSLISFLSKLLKSFHF